ncbi:MAG: hypothetical protein ACLR13_04520 [Acutalibacteraceae bacterium]
MIYFIYPRSYPLPFGRLSHSGSNPIAAIGYQHNGMCAEEFIVVLIHLFTPKHVVLFRNKDAEYSKRKERKLENTDKNKKKIKNRYGKAFLSFQRTKPDSIDSLG